MNYHAILNACSKDYAGQCAYITTFLQQQNLLKKCEYTFIIWNGQRDSDDKQDIANLVPTKFAIFIYVKQYNPEEILQGLEKYLDPTCTYIFGNNYFAKEIAVRLAGRLHGSTCLQCTTLKESNQGITVTKKVYGGHFQAVFAMQLPPFCISITKDLEGKKIPKHKVRIKEEWSFMSETPRYSYEVLSKSETSVSLDKSKFIIVLGNGCSSQENVSTYIKKIEDMGINVGVSRPVAMNGWASMARLVGVSGHMLSSSVCIALATSGAPALYAGIKSCHNIIAVNTNANAPIMKQADYVIVGDYRAFITCLEKYKVNILQAVCRKDGE